MLDGSKSMPDVLGDIPDRWTLIFGNEGSGLPPEFSRLGQPVRIPSSKKVESLNLTIAAAKGIYAIARRRHVNTSPEGEICLTQGRALRYNEECGIPFSEIGRRKEP